MRGFLISAAVAACALTIVPAHAQGDDPFARSREGAIECFSPDTANRTCRAMSRYRFEENRISNDAIVHLQNNPLVVMYATSVVYAREGMICGRNDPAELQAARFTIDDAPAPADVTQELQQVIQQVIDSLGDEACSRYTGNDRSASVTVYVDGAERPELVDRVIWIQPEDGYTIGAADTSAT